MWVNGRSDSFASRIARSRNSCGYFLGAAIQGPRFHREEHPGIRASIRSGVAQTTAIVGNNPYVVWQGTDNALWMTYFDGTRWIGACKLGMGPLGSRPSISRDESNVLTVGWKGTDGGLWYAYSPPNPGCGGWSGP